MQGLVGWGWGVWEAGREGYNKIPNRANLEKGSVTTQERVDEDRGRPQETQREESQMAIAGTSWVRGCLGARPPSLAGLAVCLGLDFGGFSIFTSSSKNPGAPSHSEM